MGHTSYDDLSDLKSILAQLRKLPGIKEPKPGIFYYKSAGFLHFHDKDGERWADVRSGESWGAPITIPFDAARKDKAKFLKEVLKRYERLASSSKK